MYLVNEQGSRCTFFLSLSHIKFTFCSLRHSMIHSTGIFKGKNTQLSYDDQRMGLCLALILSVPIPTHFYLSVQV